MSAVTRVLSAIEQGDPRAADELRKLAAQKNAPRGAGTNDARASGFNRRFIASLNAAAQSWASSMGQATAHGFKWLLRLPSAIILGRV